MNADLVEKTIGAIYEVSNVLGSGFLEKVYGKALLNELGLRGLNAKAQVRFAVAYKGQCVGEYVADLLVNDELVVEIKCVDQFCNEHVAQCINYLKASGKKIALLVNFQKPTVQLKRIVYNL